MAELVPGSGFGREFELAAAASQVVALGPIAAKSWIDVVEFGISLEGAAGVQQINLACVVSGTADVTVATLQRGVSLIQVSDTNFNGVPALNFRAIQSVFASFRLFPGYFVDSGSVYVLVGAIADAVGGTVGINVAVRTLRLEGGGAGPRAPAEAVT
jgi:hypothetical protein